MKDRRGARLWSWPNPNVSMSLLPTDNIRYMYSIRLKCIFMRCFKWNYLKKDIIKSQTTQSRLFEMVRCKNLYTLSTREPIVIVNKSDRQLKA